GALLLWDVKTGNLLRKIGKTEDWFGNVAVSADGKTVAASSQSHGVSLWDIGTGRLLHILNSEDGQENRSFPGPISFSPDGQVIASGGTEGIIYLWNVATGKEKRRLVAPAPLADALGPVMALAFAPDGKTLASAAAKAPTRVWDTNTGREIL